MCAGWAMIARTFSSCPTCWRIVVASRSSSSRRRAAAKSGSRRPTQCASAGSPTPDTSIVDQSIGTPCDPSEPSTSSACPIRAAVSASRSRASVASGPPTAAQLGSSAPSVVQPARYGYVSRVTSTPSASARSSRAVSSAARPALTSKLRVACARCSAQPASLARPSISAYAPRAPAPYERWCGQ
ncbi:hypothetical protein AA958_22440 [Streptomyces sp. CNQ-509]|nr:hypothetical protein AA958_22440 [Streptomyces sp. CNQ-509]